MGSEGRHVFTWGNGKKGQLGLGPQGLISACLPRRGMYMDVYDVCACIYIINSVLFILVLVKALSGVQCKQVSAGAYHTALCTGM